MLDAPLYLTGKRGGFAREPERQIEVTDRSFPVGINHREHGGPGEQVVLSSGNLRVGTQASLRGIGRIVEAVVEILGGAVGQGPYLLRSWLIATRDGNTLVLLASRKRLLT